MTDAARVIARLPDPRMQGAYDLAGGCPVKQGVTVALELEHFAIKPVAVDGPLYLGSVMLRFDKSPAYTVRAALSDRFDRGVLVKTEPTLTRLFQKATTLRVSLSGTQTVNRGSCCSCSPPIPPDSLNVVLQACGKRPR